MEKYEGTQPYIYGTRNEFIQTFDFYILTVVSFLAVSITLNSCKMFIVAVNKNTFIVQRFCAR